MTVQGGDGNQESGGGAIRLVMCCAHQEVTHDRYSFPRHAGDGVPCRHCLRDVGKGVAYVHVRSAVNNCYTCRIDRV